MQFFKDALSGGFWSIEDDVITREEGEGRTAFFSAWGERLMGIPETLVRVEALPDPAPPVPTAPQAVSRFQGREAMWQTPHGETTLFEAAEAIINHQDTPAMYRRAWADLQEFRRDSEMLQAIATALGLAAADLDALFVKAGAIAA